MGENPPPPVRDLDDLTQAQEEPSACVEMGAMAIAIRLIPEEPVPFDWYEETRQVADVLSVPIAGGEQEPSMRNFRANMKLFCSLKNLRLRTITNPRYSKLRKKSVRLRARTV